MMTLLQLAWLMAQTQPLQPSNPLMDRAGERIIYVGVALLGIAIALILGMLNRRLNIAIFVALALSAFLIVLLLVP
jgi:hypothetical protein